MSEKEFYLAFSLMPGIGPKKFDLLLRNFKTAEKAWNADSSELINILGDKLFIKFDNFRTHFEIEKILSDLKNKKVDFITLGEIDYPENLKKIPNPPIVLFIKGNKKIFTELVENKSVAIVGTRRMTAYGQNITEMFSSELASRGVIIISGLAIGVDSVAHKSCLRSAGKTIAVLGNGVDLCYPRENQKIYDEILEKDGLVISGMPIGEKPSVGSFPSRNRIVAGLSDGILVTEGAEDSGSLITAKFGLDFDRKVFAVPGPITSSLSAAPLKLIEKGAKLVVSPDDVIKELGMSIKSIQTQVYKSLTKEEEVFVKILENESLDFDEIVRIAKINASRVGAILSMMEIKGILKNSDGKFSLK